MEDWNAHDSDYEGNKGVGGSLMSPFVSTEVESEEMAAVTELSWKETCVFGLM